MFYRKIGAESLFLIKFLLKLRYCDRCFREKSEANIMFIGQCFFSRDTPKCPWHTFFWILSRAPCDLSRALFRTKSARDTFQNKKIFLFFGKRCPWQLLSKNVTGTFTEVTGTFSENVTGKSKIVTGKKKHWYSIAKHLFLVFCIGIYDLCGYWLGLNSHTNTIFHSKTPFF